MGLKKQFCAYLLGALALAFPLLGNAAICAYENAQGSKLFSDKPPGYGWKKRQCYNAGIPDNGPKDTTAGTRRRAASGSSGSSSVRRGNGSSLPKVSSAQQRQRDINRRRILEDELDEEVRSLQNALVAQVVGLAPASADELKNAQLYAKRVTSINETVSLHSRNVEALKKELSNIR